MPQHGCSEVAWIDIYGGTLPLNGVVAGDHVIYVDFKERFNLDARISAASRTGGSTSWRI